MVVNIVNGELVIRIPINDPPVVSKTGKTLVIATSHGNKPTDVTVGDKTLIVGVNAYIKR